MAQIGSAEPLALPGETVLSPEAWSHVADRAQVGRLDLESCAHSKNHQNTSLCLAMLTSARRPLTVPKGTTMTKLLDQNKRTPAEVMNNYDFVRLDKMLQVISLPRRPQNLPVTDTVETLMRR